MSNSQMFRDLKQKFRNPDHCGFTKASGHEKNIHQYNVARRKSFVRGYFHIMSFYSNASFPYHRVGKGGCNLIRTFPMEKHAVSYGSE